MLLVELAVDAAPSSPAWEELLLLPVRPWLDSATGHAPDAVTTAMPRGQSAAVAKRPNRLLLRPPRAGLLEARCPEADLAIGIVLVAKVIATRLALRVSNAAGPRALKGLFMIFFSFFFP